MSNIEIRFNGGQESQNIFIPATTGKKRIHLIFIKKKDKVPDNVETLIIGSKIWYDCKTCNKRFEKKSNVLTHMRLQHKVDGENYICSCCSKSFTNKNALACHERIRAERPFQCDLCNRRFDSEEKLKIHHAGQHEGRERRYNCGNCGKSFMTMQHLKEHVLSHSDQKLFTCECGKSFTRETTLMSHKKLHDRTTEYKCEFCEKVFKSDIILMRHRNRQHLQETNPDGINGKTLESNIKSEEAMMGEKDVSKMQNDTELNSAKRPENGIENKKYTKVKFETTEKLFIERQTEFICYVCGKVFTKKEGLNHHLLIHTGEKPFVCDVCNMAFRQSAHLVRHKKLHTGEKNYMCCYCNKRFSRRDHVRKHEETRHRQGITSTAGIEETVEVVLATCTICNKSYRNLKKHMKTHAPKKFKCNDCGGEWNSETSFKRHVVDGHHFIDKGTTCPVCYKEFSKFDHVRRHVINIHCSKSFKCTICGDGFLSASDFEKHVMKGHNGEKRQRKRKTKKKVEESASENSEQEEVEETVDLLELLY